MLRKVKSSRKKNLIQTIETIIFTKQKVSREKKSSKNKRCLMSIEQGGLFRFSNKKSSKNGSQLSPFHLY